jgi:ABC-type branched-subunit amino acid transport system substrate-binding protein
VYATGVGGCSKIRLRRFPLDDKLSCGEEILVKSTALQDKKQGGDAFAADDYRQAVKLLDKAWQQQHDPETLIYLNNARLMRQKAYTIAVVAPITNNKDTALEILRGVAQAQDEINHGNKRNGKSLKVLIAQSNGATGEIRFSSSGEHLESNIQLVKVVPSKTLCGYDFVLVNSPATQGGKGKGILPPHTSFGETPSRGNK